MPDTLTVITRAISEHHSIREHVKLAGDTVNDTEALTILQRAGSQWTRSLIPALAEKQSQTQQAISSLEEGLKNHFAFEEEALPTLLGELLIKAIVHEHRQISKQIKNAKTTLTDTKLEGLSIRELLSKRSVILQNINNLCQAVEEHANREELILNMMKKALEEEIA